MDSRLLEKEIIIELIISMAYLLKPVKYICNNNYIKNTETECLLSCYFMSFSLLTEFLKWQIIPVLSGIEA